MRRRTALAGAAAALLAVPAIVLAQSASDPPYGLPAPAATPAPAPPAPRLGHAVVLERVSGRVRYRRSAGDAFVRLTTPVAVPVGSEVDTDHGRVRVTVARDRDGHVWRSVFFDGRFEIEQADAPGAITHLVLTGGSFSGCATASAARATRHRRHRRVRRLWGDGHGRFQTEGRYSAATVRGTRWEVEDRCDGTVTRVARGVVTVTDYTTPAPEPMPNGGGGVGAPAPTRTPSRPRQVRVHKGQTYVAGPGG